MRRAGSLAATACGLLAVAAGLALWLASPGGGRGDVPWRAVAGAQLAQVVMDGPHAAPSALGRTAATASEGAARASAAMPPVPSAEVWLRAIWERDGSPASGVSVELTPRGSRHARPRRGLTDAAGATAFVDVVPGAWTATADLGGGASFNLEPGGVGRVELELPGGARRERNRARARWHSCGRSAGAPRLHLRSRLRRPGARLLCRWALQAAFHRPGGTFAVASLQAGRQTLEIDGGAQGFASAVLELFAGAVTHWEGTLEPGEVLRGRVVDGDGLPLAGWAVFATWPDTPDRPSHLVESGLDGRFELFRPDAGPVTLSVSREGTAPRPLLHRPGCAPGRGEVLLEVTDELVPAGWICAQVEGVDDAVLMARSQATGEIVQPLLEAAFETRCARVGPLAAGACAAWVRFGDALPQLAGEFELMARESVDLGLVRRAETGEIVVSLTRPDGGTLERVQFTLTDAAGLELWSRTLEGESLRTPPTIESVPEGSFRLGAFELGSLRNAGLDIEVRAGTSSHAILVLTHG